MKHIVLTLAILVGASSAHAKGSSGWLLGLNLDYSATKVEGAVPIDSNSTGTNLKFGQITGSGLYWGLVYLMSSGSGGTSSSGYGASVGYFNNGWYGMFNYLLSHENKTSGTTTLKNATGMGVEIGYMLSASGSFNVMLSMNYNTINYKKLDTSGTLTDVDEKYTLTSFPSVTFAWVF